MANSLAVAVNATAAAAAAALTAPKQYFKGVVKQVMGRSRGHPWSSKKWSSS